MHRTIGPLALLFILAGTGISMSGQVIQGNARDPRVTSCGVEISGDRLTTVRPFIQTSEPLTGTVDLRIDSISGSNRNSTVQKTSLSSMPVVTVSADRLNIRLTMQSEGRVLCEIDEQVDMGSIRI
ncbi:hypothetical protein [Oricola sp.]|uniref:hypothetical protein n=1 Tax=Oricola sp. TaxID=1979950 RepID=UPI000C8FF287|nr:hypothetical protein [Ahrensia sp.]MCK5747790.1 hypothetical protein [Oricola sp.]|tara:strand:- start:16952 stop:17329 length:378 start_codon:yes stop_codon:yes gene_type:complete